MKTSSRFPAGFTLVELMVSTAIIGLIMIVLGFVLPRYYDVFVPPQRRNEGLEPTVANEPKGLIVERAVEDAEARDRSLKDGGEAGLARRSSSRDRAVAQKTNAL